MYTLTSRTLAIILLLTTCTALAFCQMNVCRKSRLTRSTSKKPEIFERPQSQKVHVNQSATFLCRVKSDSPVTITWMRHKQELSHRPGSILLGNDSLILLHVQKSDGGIFKCIARNEVGASSSEATLTILDPLIAPLITQVTINQTVLEGQRVTLTCKATGNPQPKINWRISSGRLSHNQPERPSPGSIRFLSSTPSDSGTYSCIAVNEQGNDTRVVYLNVIGYPVFIESPPLNLTVHENVTVSLNCKVIGSPTPDVRWYYGNKQAGQDSKTVILKNGTLVISRINFENSGTYTCVANNSAGLRRSKSTLLQVLSRPRLSCCPDNNAIVRNRTAIDGNHLSLNCSAKGHPEPKYEWRFNNITISQSALFTIPRVSKNREGVYSCRIYNNLGTLLVKILLSVLIPPKVTVKPGRKIVLPGASVEFVCIATGEPVPKISWYLLKSGKIISHNRSLVIANVTENDEGEYLCKGQSTVGQSVAKATLVLAVQPTFTIVPPRNVTANETSFVRVRCSAKLDPERPIINWYRLTTEGEKINISSSEKITLGRDTLKISQLVRDDGGFYLCEAKNLAGVINTTFFINIQYRPRLIILGQHVSAKVGETASLHCPVKANPAAQIRWIHPDRLHGYGVSHILIPIVNISDGGNYTCIAANLLGTLQSFVEVTVLTSPRIVGLTRVEKRNGWISLTCKIEGTPQPTVCWLDQATLPSGSFHVLLDGNLRMEKRYINMMEFVCNASNTYGWTAKYVKTPSSPYQLNVVGTTPSSVTFSWMANNSEIISDFVVERLSKADSNWVTVNSSVAFSMFTDQDLQPFTWFLFRVYCKNVLGTSGPSETLNVTTPEGVPSPPASMVVVSRELMSITVEWKPPKELRGLFTSIFYEVSYMKCGSLFDDKMKISINSSVQYRLKITNLKSKTCYVIKVRAGRRSNYCEVYWSGYTLVQINTLQEAPVIPPEIKRISSNGPRRIFVSWKRPIEYVEGYELLYKKYESRNNITVKISSWNTTRYTITGLSASQYYDIQLRMFTSGGYGPWSSPAFVIHTDEDKFASSGNLSSFSDGLTWKIALGVSISALILLSFLLVYVYWARKSKNNSSDKKERTKSRKKDGYNFDIGSHESNESEGSIEGIYNVNTEEDIDLSMFDNSHHATATDSNLYIENPILPPDQLESDEAVMLATFTTRPSPFGTPCGSPSLSKQNLFEFNELSSQDVVQSPVYAKIDFSAKARRNRSADTFEQKTDEVLI